MSDTLSTLPVSEASVPVHSSPEEKELLLVGHGFSEKGHGRPEEADDTMNGQCQLMREANYRVHSLPLPNHKNYWALCFSLPFLWAWQLGRKADRVWRENGEVPLKIMAFSLFCPLINQWIQRHPDRVDRVFFASPANGLRWYFKAPLILLNIAYFASWTLILLFFLYPQEWLTWTHFGIAAAIVLLVHIAWVPKQIRRFQLLPFEYFLEGETKEAIRNLPLWVLMWIPWIQFIHSWKMWRHGIPDIPYLIVWGEQDKVVSPKSIRSFCDKAPNANRVSFSGGTHVAIMEHSNTVNAHLGQFMETNV